VADLHMGRFKLREPVTISDSALYGLLGEVLTIWKRHRARITSIEIVDKDKVVLMFDPPLVRKP
jgi:hypothetical protein